LAGAAAGLGDIVRFGSRLARPRSPEGQAAWEGALQAGHDAIGALGDAAAHPDAVVQRAAQALHDLGQSVTPDMRPAGPDRAGQLRRNFEAGTNAGDLSLQGAMFALPEAKGLTAAPALTREELVAKYMKDFSLKDAEYLAEPYPRQGHHAVARRTRFPVQIFGWKLPSAIAGKPLPKAFMESRFNLVKPKGISRGEFYELHVMVDPRFHGTGGLPDSGRWSARDLGIRRYDPIRRIWHGTPAATKKAAAGVAGAGAAAAALAQSDQKGGERR